MEKKVTFNTNINCQSCYDKVENALSGKELVKDFKVDFANPKKPATLVLNDGVNTEDVIKLINEAGYKAEVAEEPGFLKKLFGSK